jgi:hypothetical protein
MTYLGLQIPSEIIKTYQLNYTPLLKKVGEELDRWRDLPISLIGQPFSWKPQKITYLGLQIPSEISKRYPLNYTPLLKKVGEELDRWRDLPISHIGQVNCVKMNILPQFLYLFQNFPLPIPKVFFQTT